jgi:hypothetical protein
MLVRRMDAKVLRIDDEYLRAMWIVQLLDLSRWMQQTAVGTLRSRLLPP